jgi:Uma2 family endonuclease
MSTVAQTMTAQEFLEMPNQEHYELVQGEPKEMSPPGFDHGCIVSDIAAVLREFVRSRKLGAVAVEAGFCIARDPDTVRSPDVAFVRAERVPAGGVPAFFQGAPDLAVEVISPSDRLSDILAKTQEWLQAGSAAVWVVDPKTRTVTVYGKQPQTLFLSTNDALACDELLPGFRLPVSEIFAR